MCPPFFVSDSHINRQIRFKLSLNLHPFILCNQLIAYSILFFLFSAEPKIISDPVGAYLWNDV